MFVLWMGNRSDKKGDVAEDISTKKKMDLLDDLEAGARYIRVFFFFFEDEVTEETNSCWGIVG